MNSNINSAKTLSTYTFGLAPVASALILSIIYLDVPVREVLMAIGACSLVRLSQNDLMKVNTK